MIKPQDLRIGNWLIDGNGSYYRVEIPDLALLLSRPDTKECNPIELSAEILEKAGFKLDGRSMFYEKPDCPFQVFDDLEQISIGQNVLNARIKYLHQLQNLHFALTGEELPVEL